MGGFVFFFRVGCPLTRHLARAKVGDHESLPRKPCMAQPTPACMTWRPELDLGGFFERYSPEKWNSLSNRTGCMPGVHRNSVQSHMALGGGYPGCGGNLAKCGAWVFADNTFAPPYCQRRSTLGADVVVPLPTKYLSGHGQIVGGRLSADTVDFVNGILYAS